MFLKTYVLKPTCEYSEIMYVILKSCVCILKLNYQINEIQILARFSLLMQEITDKQGEKVRMFQLVMITTGDNSGNT